MAIDIKDLLNKTENDGSSPQGRLSSSEWNKLVTAVQENQEAVQGVVRGIRYNKQDKIYNDIDENGILDLVLSNAGDRTAKIIASTFPDNSIGSHYITPSDPCIVEFVVEDEINEGGELVPYENPGLVNYYINNELVDTVKNVYPAGSAYFNGTLKVDFNKYGKLHTSSDGNQLKIEYVNNGVIAEKQYPVWVVDIKLLVDNVETIYTEDNLQNIKVNFIGYNEYLLNCRIDDTVILDNQKCSSDTDEYISASTMQAVKNTNTHGIHTISIWASINIPNNLDPEHPFVLSTPVQEYTYIYGDKYSLTPVIISNVAAGSKFELYGTIGISYFAYLANANTSKDINIKIVSATQVDENKKPLVLFNTDQKITFSGDTYSGYHAFTLFPHDAITDKHIIGDAIIQLSIDGNDPYDIPIVIEKSSIILTSEQNYRAYFNAQGRNNSETDTLRVWESSNPRYPEIVTKIKFDDNIEFTDGASGWKNEIVKNAIGEEETLSSLYLRRGRYFTLEYKPFETNPTYPNNEYGTGQGLTLSFEFATRNCLNANTKVVECLNNDRGFYITANTAKLCGNDVTIQTEFKEDQRVRVDIVIDDKLRTYTGVSAEGKKGELKEYSDTESYAIIFIDGVYSTVGLIGDSTSFKQDEPQFIKFGSADCDIDIYNIRIYNKTLSLKNIVDNYSFDTPSNYDKFTIAKRNLNVLSENTEYPFMPNINVEPARMSNGADGGLKIARPELPLFYITLDKSYNNILPNSKDSENACQNTFTQFVNPILNDPANVNIAKCSFEVENAELKNQGTSSMNYPWPWRNMDWAPKSDFYMPKLGSTLHSSKWFQYDYALRNDALKLKKITLKKDYASSEMCNNAICSSYFTDMALSIYKNYIDTESAAATPYEGYPGVLSPAMYKDVKTNGFTDLRLTLKSLPCFCIEKLNDVPADVTTKMPNNSDANTFALGMMNLIPNKNEVGYLGFTNNKWEDEESTSREQSWELSENIDDLFWVKPISYIYKGENGYVSELDGNYEARTPKDSSVFNETDFGQLGENLQGDSADSNLAQKLYDEQKDIIDFHNWAVSVDRGGANPDKPLYEIEGWVQEDWNYNTETGGLLYEFDTKEYRFAKFKAEAPQRLIIDQWIMYYIWREQFWMFDSGFKNLQVYTVGENPQYKDSGVMQWGCMVRDADTALGIQNVGIVVFPPYLEDVDYCIKSASGYEFHYNGAENIYSLKDLRAINPSADPVLNGQFGSLWLNIRDAYPAQIASMYRALAGTPSASFTANAAIKKFREHQEHWCESLYNFGLRQFIGGKMFSKNLNAACGDKKQGRASWLEKGFFYRASKYRALADDYLNFRGATYETTGKENAERGDSIRVKTYMPMYIGLGGNTSSMLASPTHLRIVNTDENGNCYRDIKVGEGGFRYTAAADTNNYIFGASNITDIGDLARYIKVANLQKLDAPKIRKYEFGHEPARTDGVPYKEIIMVDGVRTEVPISNTICTDKLANFNGCPQLELLDLTNLVKLEGISIDKCNLLKELYLRGTDSIKSVKFPQTNTLEKLYLSDKLISLDLTNLSGIKELVCDGLNNCTQLIIRNSGPVVAKKQVSYNLMTSVINNKNLNKLILEDIDWDLKGDTNAIKYLEKILELREIFGKENIVLKGTIKNLTGLTGDLKVKLCDKTAFGDIDNPENDLYILYDQIPIASISLPSKIYIYKEGETYDVKNDLRLLTAYGQDIANTYVSSEWTMTPKNSFATCSKDGIITRTAEPADENSLTAELVVTVYQMDEIDKNGNATPREPISNADNPCKVYFYERLAKPGDFVFNDGTFSDELDSNKTPIGICFYVDPTNKENRLMCALDSIGSGKGYSWGESKGQYWESMGYWGGAAELTTANPLYDCYDVLKTSNNIDDAGFTPNDEILYSDSNYRSNTAVNNDLFKSFEKGTYVGDLGWKTATDNIKVDGLSMPNGDTTLTINIGDRVPSGYFNTLAIIQHRNVLLDTYENVNDQEGAFVRPYSTEDYSELYILNKLLEDSKYYTHAERTDLSIINSGTHGSGGQHMYYGAASACFAYEPVGVDNLSDKFKKHNWFLPASGDLIRLNYYIYQSYKDGKAQETPVNSVYANANAFYNAFESKKCNLYKHLTGANMWSSTENNADNAVVIVPVQNISAFTSFYNTTYKSYDTSSVVIPICAF